MIDFPNKFKDKFNYRAEFSINVRKNLINKSPLVFEDYSLKITKISFVAPYFF